jgi:DNA (cytosine-5)-methyltransferase 1
VRPLTFGSVCSGIGGAELAFEGLAESVFMSEIAEFPRKVLVYRFPHTKLLGDFTTLIENPIPCDILVGGCPCQAFSIAGKRLSLEDARGNLALAFAVLLNSIDDINQSLGEPPCVCLFENVPGLLSVTDNAFGCLLAALVGFDSPIINPRGEGRWPSCGLVMGPRRQAAWRVLDAQYHGLAQRRKRVFVVASAREGFDPTAVLLEPKSLSRNLAPGRKARKDITGTLSSRTSGGGGLGTDFDLDGGCIPVSLTGFSSYAETLPTLRAKGGDCSGGSEALVPIAFGGGNTSGPIATATARTANDRYDFDSETFVVQNAPVTAFNWQSGGDCRIEPREDQAHTLQVNQTQAVLTKYAVRRLTPIEAERLQGFPDCHTLIPNCSRSRLEDDYLAYLRQYLPDLPIEEVEHMSKDGNRYKAIGNGFAVNCVRWIAKRIVAEIERIG